MLALDHLLRVAVETAVYCLLWTLPIVIAYRMISSGMQQDWYYVIKRFACRERIKRFMANKAKLSALHWCPQTITDDARQDLWCINGRDTSGNSILLKFTIGSEKCAKVFLLLRTSAGRIFTLPQDGAHFVTRLRNGNEWRCKYLTVTPQLTGRKSNYRIVFNGLARDSASDTVTHLKFNVLWVAAANKMAYPQDYDSSLFARPLCAERWCFCQRLNLLGNWQGYDQIGVIHGQVRIKEFSIEQDWYLRGHLTRSIGHREEDQLSRQADLVIHCENGDLIHLNTKSLRDASCSELKTGCVYYARGQMVSITDCDFFLAYLPHSPAKLVVHVTTKISQIKCVIYLDKTTEFCLPEQDTDSGQTSNVKCYVNVLGSCTFDNQRANVIFTSTTYSEFGKNVKIAEFNSLDLMSPSGDISADCTGNCFLVDLGSPLARNVSLSGGKGQSLAILASLQGELHVRIAHPVYFPVSNENLCPLQFYVPAAFVLTTHAFDKCIGTNEAIKAAVFNVCQICYTSVNVSLKDIEKSCEELQETIMKEYDTLRKQLLPMLSIKWFEGKIISWAVRSSGVTEDSESASAAGQNETILGCCQVEQICRGVVKCWASLYSFRSVEYRRNKGLPIETTMAVVIQIMVRSEIAGVMFTCDDLDGNPQRLKITSNYGLGESIVSGLEGGDTVTVTRYGDTGQSDSLEIEDVAVGNKKKKIVLTEDEGNGVETVAIATEDASEQSITDEQMISLAQVGCRLEEKYGMFLDIEWAFDEITPKPILLQARPVTFLENWTDYEIEHEFDSASMSDWDVFVTSNVKEVFPSAVTPLTNSIICFILNGTVTHDLYNGSRTDKLDPFQVVNRKCIPSFRNHIFMDLYRVMLVYPRKELSIENQCMDVSVCGHTLTTETMLQRAQSIQGGTMSFRKQLSLMWGMFRDSRRIKQLVLEAKNLAHFGQELNPEMTFEDLEAVLRKTMDDVFELGLIHCVTSRVSSSYQIVIVNALAKGQKEVPQEVYTLTSMFLNAGSGVISAEVPRHLEGIAKGLKKVSNYEELFESEDREEWLAKNAPDAFEKYQDFMRIHGHRSYREFEIMEPSWSESPDTIFNTLKTMCRLSLDQTTSDNRQTNLTVDQVLDQLPPGTNRTVFKYLANTCRSAVIAREASKCELIRAINYLKKIFKVLAVKLRSQMKIPQESLIYFLTYDEIIGLIHNERINSSLLITKAYRRQRLYPKFDAYKFAEVNEGRPVPLNLHGTRPATVSPDGGTLLKGTPASAGVITARCLSIDSLDNVDQLQAGDILVTHGTDVGWTPYFPLLSGVVTELGGLISHGAVIAREYGLPCLIGVEGALQTFRTGDIITLDASKGVVYRN